MQDISSPVVIAGQGLSGLTMALFLAWYGLPNVLVERPGDRPPEALPIVLSPHTVELFRVAGLEAGLRRAAISSRACGNLHRAPSGVNWKPAPLPPGEIRRLEHGRDARSPCRGIATTQNALAALLRSRAEVLGSDLRFGSRLIAFEPDLKAIEVVVEQPVTGRRSTLRSHYLALAGDNHDETRLRQSQPSGDLEPGGISDDAERFTAQYQSGRAFIVGRTAHAIASPASIALNLDLQEAHNLAWKLAYVLKGLAGPGLLETYEAERRPLAEAAIQVASTHSDARGRLSWDWSGGRGLAGIASIMGPAIYHSNAVVLEAEDEQRHLQHDPRRLNGRPGTRVPHLVLQRNGKSLSTLDLCGGDFVLLAGPKGQSWCEAAERTAAGMELDLEAYCIGPGQVLSSNDRRWPAAYGLTESGALLVRPDGYIGWRVREARLDADGVLAKVLTHLLCRESGGGYDS